MPIELSTTILPDPWKRSLTAAFLLVWALSCLCVPYPKYFWLQHVPTVIGLCTLVIVDRRIGVSRLSYSLIAVFLLLHVVGARYLYSYVPYDDWSQQLLGFRPTDRFALKRNHYDRFVHLCFGLLLVIPTCRFAQRFGRMNATWSGAFALSSILAASALYEIFEWFVAITMAPDWAESYNGQQGDPWDAQWDMALAMVGAAISLGVFAIIKQWIARCPATELPSRQL